MPSRSDSSYAAHELDESADLPDWGERLQRFYFEGKRLFFAWWWIILLTVASGIGWQAYQELNRDPVYISQAEMMISGRFALPDTVYREELSNFFGTQISLMMSPQVRKQARERVTMLHPEIPQSWVSLSVNQRPQASIFQLRAEGGNPEFTRAFLDAVMEEYQNFRREMRSETTENTLLAVTEQLYRLEEEIHTQENTIVDFQKANNLVFLREQDASTGAYLARLTTQQAELRTQLLRLENLEPGDVVNASTEQTPLIRSETAELYNQTREEWIRLRVELEEFSRSLKPRHPKIIDLELNIERAANLIEILNQQTIRSLSERKDQLRREIKNLDAVIAQWEQQALTISRKGAEFERLQYRLDRSRSTYQRLLDSVQAIQSNENIEQETVGILATASPAHIRPPEVAKQVMQGGVAGLVLGIAFIAGIAILDTRIRSSDELAKRFDHPILAVIPEEALNKNGQVNLLQHRDERYRFAEACRSLRSSLLLHYSQQGEVASRAILISSSTPSEGKSTLSSNFAIALSFLKKRVLLIDADMRRGGIHHQFATGNNKAGLSDLLRCDSPFSDFIDKTDFEHLDLLENGAGLANSSELILSERMDALLAWAKEHYDYVVIDAPPVLAVDDAVGLASKADSLLMVVRANQTSARQVALSLDRLSTLGDKVVGFAFNCAPVSGVDYYYNYRSYHSYYQQPQEEATAELAGR